MRNSSDLRTSGAGCGLQFGLKIRNANGVAQPTPSPLYTTYPRGALVGSIGCVMRVGLASYGINVTKDIV